MTDTPPNWVLIEAAKRCDWAPGKTLAQMRGHIYNSGAYRALCDMIQKYEQPPVDRKLLCAREAIARAADSEIAQRQWRNGINDHLASIEWTVRAIELWEEGFGK